MTGDDTANLIYVSIAAMLVASSLFARRMPVGQTLRMVLIWLGIFAAAFILFSYRAEFASVWQRVKSELSPGGTIGNDGTLRVRMNDDGHFWLDVEINGHPVRMMVDSGATTTSLSMDTVRAARVKVSENPFPVVVETANGLAEAQRATIETLRVGPIERRNLPVLVSENFGDTNLIGMNFLSTLSSWRVEGRELILNPKRPAAGAR